MKEVVAAALALMELACPLGMHQRERTPLVSCPNTGKLVSLFSTNSILAGTKEEKRVDITIPISHT